MEQRSLFSHPNWTVSELTRYLKDLLESDDLLQDIRVQGEVSNLSRPSSGHIYFTLKDSGAALRCVMWRASVSRLSFAPREGLAIEAHGSLSIYETSGQYQLYVDSIRPAGEGGLYQEFLRLKARLEKEGLFDSARKRPIPEFPRRIGIVTSPTGAALRDMLKTIRRRFAAVEVFISPTVVQGSEAPAGIVSALHQLNRLIRPDIILLARGGGSIEDLWAFNDEEVARAIAASDAPVITGVGHETDFTIADFVSDLRAPTPTGAAEMATPDREDLAVGLKEQDYRLRRATQASISFHRNSLGEAMRALDLQSPTRMIRSERQRIDDILRLSEIAIVHHFQVRWIRLGGLEKSLNSLNPTAVLGRGYAIVKDRKNRTLTSIKQVKYGDEISVLLKDGDFPAIVNNERQSTQ